MVFFYNIIILLARVGPQARAPTTAILGLSGVFFAANLANANEVSTTLNIMSISGGFSASLFSKNDRKKFLSFSLAKTSQMHFYLVLTETPSMAFLWGL
jgi:hypothetical protein